MSKNARILRELRFVHLSEDRSSSEIVGPEKPWFWMKKEEEATIAIDETGQGWLATEIIDLSVFGFEDRSAKMDAALVGFGDSKDFAPKN